MGYLEKTARKIFSESPDGLTTDTGTNGEFSMYYDSRTAFFEAKKTLTVEDFMPEASKSLIRQLNAKVARNELKPDEGTLRDFTWLKTYMDFGHFVEVSHPLWGVCDHCHQTRLCTHQVEDLSRVCFECRYKEMVMKKVNDLQNLDLEPVKSFLNNGNLDPSKLWKTYQDIIKEELEAFQRKSIERDLCRREFEDIMSGPYIPLKRMNNGI